MLAEGVETSAQFAAVINEGCDEVQSYLIGRLQPQGDEEFVTAA